MRCWYNPSPNNLVSLETIVQTIRHTGVMTEQQQHQLQALSSGWTLTAAEQTALDELVELLYRQEIRTGCQRHLRVVA